jgi:hypothetical protein
MDWGGTEQALQGYGAGWFVLFFGGAHGLLLCVVGSVALEKEKRVSV